MQIGTYKYKVERLDGEVVIRLNESTASELADIVESHEKWRTGEPFLDPVTWTDLVADIRTAPDAVEDEA